MGSMAIRKANYLDIEHISRIYKRQINEIKGFKRVLLGMYRKPRFRIYVLISDKAIVGFYLIEVISGFMPRKFKKGVWTIWVHFLAVETHGQGYGRRLMEHIEGHAADDSRINGIGLHSNMAAYPFYEKMGLVVQGKVKHGHIPKVYMRKNI